MTQRRLLLVAVVLILVVIGLAIGGGLDTGSGSNPTGAACGSLAVGGILPNGSKLTAEQAGNAQTIYGVIAGSGIDDPNQAAVDALNAAWTESTMENLNGGDRDSLGFFQERPSQGWGTPEQIMDPNYETTVWLQHLSRIPNWPSVDPATVDQDVEVSAYPDRYKTWTTTAQAQVAGLTGGAAACNNGSGSPAAGSTSLPPGFTLPAGTPPQVASAISFAFAQLGKPYSETIDGGVGPNDFDCSGLVQQAYASAGIAIPRTTYTQYQVGQLVLGAQNIQAGDLIFIPGSDPGPGGAPGHVVMSIGSGLIIQAPYTGQKIQVDPLTTISSQIVTIRRIVATAT